MMDDALLRPGRLEVQIEIGLPKEAGRTQVYSNVILHYITTFLPDPGDPRAEDES